jgi:hypothetical protein
MNMSGAKQTMWNVVVVTHISRKKNTNPFYDNSNEDNNNEWRMRIQEYSMHYNDIKRKKNRRNEV